MSKDYNVYEMWKEFFNQSSSFFDAKTQEEFPSQGMSQILEFNLQFKKILNEMTERYFEQVNIPTRTDIANISSLVVNVDAKVDEVEEIVEETKANQDEQSLEVANLKKEIKNLDNKLDQILNLISSPAKAPAAPAAKTKEQSANKTAVKPQ
jgi:polyhydroxyalkanoic acid synthase PhaR subunit